VAEHGVADLVVSEPTCIVDRVARGDLEHSDVVDPDEHLGHLDRDAAKEEDSGHISLCSH